MTKPFSQQFLDEAWKVLCKLNKGTEADLSKTDKQLRDSLENIFSALSFKQLGIK